MSEKMFMERFSWGRKGHPDCGPSTSFLDWSPETELKGESELGTGIRPSPLPDCGHSVISCLMSPLSCPPPPSCGRLGILSRQWTVTNRDLHFGTQGPLPPPASATATLNCSDMVTLQFPWQASGLQFSSSGPNLIQPGSAAGRFNVLVGDP